MSEEGKPQGRWQGARNYLGSLVRVHPPAAQTGEKIRSFIKWVFEILRNTLMVGGVYYLGLKSKNWWLITGSQALAILLCAQIWTYLDALIIQVLPNRKSPSVGSFINALIHVLIVSVLSYVSIWGIGALVQQIADANLAKPQ